LLRIAPFAQSHFLFGDAPKRLLRAFVIELKIDYQMIAGCGSRRRYSNVRSNRTPPPSLSGITAKPQFDPVNEGFDSLIGLLHIP
jgi:hypothetical protein